MLKTWFLDSATARELDLQTTGHAYRSVSSPPSPGPSNLHLAAGAKSAEALIAEIADGFYVTDLIGVGVNLVTGDYSRGASGFWIENGAAYFSGERSHHRRASERNLQEPDAGERPRLPLRHQCADRARGGPDCCRPLRSSTLNGKPRALRTAVREAGALALSMFKTPLKNWTKGEALSPVSDADIAVDVLLRERLTGDGASIAWLSEESVDDLARLDARYVWIVDPIDGTRAYIAGLPDWAVSAALVENGRPVAACLYAPVSDEFFFAVAGQGARRNGVAIAATSGAQIEQARIAGPKKFLERVASHRAAVCRHAAHALAGAAPGPDRRGDIRRRPLPAATATTGTLRPPTFWCTKRAAH